MCSSLSFIAAAYVDTIFGQTPTTVTGVIAEDVVWGFTFLALYGWIVTNVNVAIKADFFNRDALKWKAGGGVASPVAVFATYALISIPPWWIPAWVTQSAIAGDLITLIFAGVALYAAAVLAITYRRIKDRRIKNYTKWAVLSIVALLLVVTLSLPYLGAVWAVLWVYCMYRSVGSLAIKVNKLEAS